MIEAYELPPVLSDYTWDQLGLVVESIDLYGMNSAIGKFVLAEYSNSIAICYVFHTDKDLYLEVKEQCQKRKNLRLIKRQKLVSRF